MDIIRTQVKRKASTAVEKWWVVLDSVLAEPVPVSLVWVPVLELELDESWIWDVPELV